MSLDKEPDHGGTCEPIENMQDAGDSPHFHPTTDLSENHARYIRSRHGTLDLDPLPSMDPADPLNWPLWKVKPPNSWSR